MVHNFESTLYTLQEALHNIASYGVKCPVNSITQGAFVIMIRCE